MKLRNLIAALCVPAMLCLPACQKERLAPGDPVAAPETEALSAQHKAYRTQGELVQKALVAGLAQPELRALLREQALVMEDGDTEVLLKDFLNHALPSGQKVTDLLLDQYHQRYGEARINRTELEAFSTQFPSIIIGVRGPVWDWETSTHIPTTLFLPLDFKESTTSMPGMNPQGEMVDVDLSRQFEQVVITLAPSERHTARGVLKTNANLARMGNNPSVVDINEVARKDGKGDGGGGGNLTVVEPMTCATPATGLTAPTGFTATTTPSGIVLTWNTDNYAQYAPLGSWARWAIYRDGQPYRHVEAGDPPTFTDNSLAPNTTYTYSIRFSLISETETCSSPWVTAFATSPGLPDPITNFSEVIQNASYIHLTWSNPNQYHTQVRLERYYFNTNQWSAFGGNLPAGTTSHIVRSWTFGEKHLFRVRVKGLTGWSEPVHNVIMNPYRDDGMPLLVYGFRIADVTNIENPALGIPEMHVSATNGNFNPATQLPSGNLIHNNTFVPLVSCGGNQATDFRVAGNALALFSQWAYNSYGAVCRVALVETDQTDPFIDDLTVSSGQQSSFSLTATTPIEPDSTISYGNINATSNFQFTTSESFTINTVDGDRNLGTTIIHYWEHYNRAYVFPTVEMLIHFDPNTVFTFCN